jgi:hypothetical protein
VKTSLISLFIRENFKYISFGDFFKASASFFFGLSKIVKFILLRFLRSDVNSFPLGYTDNFVEYIKSQNVTLELNKFKTTSWSDYRGVEGYFDRKLAISSIKNRNLNVYVNSFWGGSTNSLTSNYVISLTKGNLSFCPPGFLNTDSFRYYESLFLGNLPVKLLLSFNSLSFNSRSYLYPMLFSWEKLFDFYEHLSCEEVVELINLHHFYYAINLKTTKNILFSYLDS